MPELSRGLTQVASALVERSAELRRRLVVSLAGVAVASVAGYALVPTVLRALTRGMPQVLLLRPVDALNARLSLALSLGAVFCLPLLEWQLVSLAAPYLSPSGRRLGRRLIPLSTLLFLAGVFFSYVGVYPFAMKFFLVFHPPGVTPALSLESVVGFALLLFLPSGLVFELPIALYFLARSGLLKPEMMTRNWKLTIFVLFVVASVITPGPDLISTFAMFVPLTLMYFGSILVVRAVWKRKLRKRGLEATAVPEEA
jgi:sec-independent protein translocase protein TatC